MDTSKELITFKVWGRTYITNKHGEPIKSDDTDSISSIQIALTNAKYHGPVPTSESEGQRILATILKTNFELDAHELGYSEADIEIIRGQEPENPWKAEVFWAIWYNYQYI